MSPPFTYALIVVIYCINPISSSHLKPYERFVKASSLKYWIMLCHLKIKLGIVRIT